MRQEWGGVTVKREHSTITGRNRRNFKGYIQ